MRIVLPFPARELSPNARCHWAVKAAAVRKYRDTCHWLAKGTTAPSDGAVRITFHPRTAHRVDDDNLIASFKAGRDGLCAAWGIDDAGLRPEYVIAEPVKDGAVVVEVPV
jgi:crossover junction endodeoxyribonuclease RusA